MTSKKEIQAPTLAQAIAQAAQAMGIAESDVHYRLIDEGRKGVLGIGRRDVRIEIEIASQPPRAVPKGVVMSVPTGKAPTGKAAAVARSPRETSEGRSATPRDGSDERQREGRPPRERRRGGRGRRGRGGRGDRPDGAAPANRTDRQDGKGREPQDDRQGNVRREPRSERGRGRRRERSTSAESGPPMEIAPETLESFRGTVQNMMNLAGLELAVAVEPTPTGVCVELTGDDLELVSNKDTEFQFGLQFLLNRMSRRAFPDIGRIQIGQDGRRSARDEELIAEIREVAGQVARTGVAKKLHPMNPYERRLVHLTVREFEGLETCSEGDGFLKTVTVCRD